MATDIRDSPSGVERGNGVGSSGTKGTSGMLNHVAGMFSLAASRAAAFLGGGVTVAHRAPTLEKAYEEDCRPS